MSIDAPRKFPPPWDVSQDQHGFTVSDANGVAVAKVYCNDHLHRQQFDDYERHLTSDEARRIAKAIARIPEFMMQRRGFHPRKNWRVERPYHVALENLFVSERWQEIDALCKLNGLPFNATGEKFQAGGMWCVYAFANQMDAILFWAAFDGRWLRGDEFHYPERPADIHRCSHYKIGRSSILKSCEAESNMAMRGSAKITEFRF